MSEKKLPFTSDQIKKIIEQHPTPFHIYDEKGILSFAKELNEAFSWNKGFKEYFAVKALPNPYIIKLLMKQGFGADCSSLPEILLAEKAGITGENIIFTSNDTPVYEYKKAKDVGAIINLDDISHISYFDENVGLPELVCLRYNPGSLKGGNLIIGHPEEAKYGFTREQLFEGYKILKSKGVTRFGLHTMVASNELDPAYFIETADILFNLVAEIYKELGIVFEFVNLGGGIGIPYKPEQQQVNIDVVSNGIKQLYEKIILGNKHPHLKLYLEAGRVITGPYGFLVSKVLHIKKTYKNYAGLDSCMANLMRPALYGSYHHVTVIDKENKLADVVYDVTGSLCENNDKFAINRSLPQLEPGDLIVIHDTGAHGHAMGFNYNGKLRSAELLLRENGEVISIRRAETIDDYFATLNMDALKTFN